MAATHHGYNVLKMPGCSGVIIFTCDEKGAVYSLDHAYRTIAAENSNGEETPALPEATPAKKK